MNFKDMKLIDSSLEFLEDDVRRFMRMVDGISKRSSSSTLRTHTWYKEFKPRMVRLVGFMANDPDLQSSKAYEVAYKHFIDMMGI